MTRSTKYENLCTDALEISTKLSGCVLKADGGEQRSWVKGHRTCSDTLTGKVITTTIRLDNSVKKITVQQKLSVSMSCQFS
jgi:hypothetical protein